MALVKICGCGAKNPQWARKCETCKTPIVSIEPRPDPDSALEEPREGQTSEGVRCAAPDCQLPNTDDATVCIFCGRTLPRKQAAPLESRETPCDSDGHVGVEVLWDWGPTPVVGELRIGRDQHFSSLHEKLADLAQISRRHAILRLQGTVLTVEDQRSKNGTFVNDIKVPTGTLIELKDGDRLRFGTDVNTLVRFRNAC